MMVLFFAKRYFDLNRYGYLLLFMAASREKSSKRWLDFDIDVQINGIV
jgi:hypothetical protein